MNRLITFLVFTISFVILTSLSYAGFSEDISFGHANSAIAWVDFNNDGYLDLVTNGAICQVLKNIDDGHGGRTLDVANPIPLIGTGSASTICTADFNNDGWEDIAVGINGINCLFKNIRGSGLFQRIPAFNGNTTSGENTRSMAWCDANEDGWVDMIVGNLHVQGSVTDRNYIFYNNQGNGTFTPSAKFNDDPAFEGNISRFTMCIAPSDFDNDGDMDVAVGNERSMVMLYQFTGGTQQYTYDYTLGQKYVLSLAWGDYDNDGDMDLALSSDMNCASINPNILYINDYSSTLSSIPFMEELPFGILEADIDSQSYSLAWGDADNDGDLDLAISNKRTTLYGIDQDYLYVQDANHNFTREDQFGDYPYTNSMAWGDYDNDGDLDMAVARSNNNYSYIYKNDTGGSSFLEVHLHGQYRMRYGSNYSGIGAKVKIYSSGHVGEEDSLLGYREINSNGGLCGQDALDAHFGFSSSPGTVDILVEWPGSGGGNITEYWTYGTGQKITLTEGTGTPY